jgi:formylglycine-generating enzyme
MPHALQQTSNTSTMRRTVLMQWLAIVLVSATGSAIVRSEPGPTAAHDHDMILIKGGTFQMGFAHGHADEKPLHEVQLDSFLLDRHPVTNRQFARFVEATGYVTQAERQGHAWGFLPGDTGFRQIDGANWRQPEGKGSTIDERMEHPVVCVSWHDAQAYAEWAGIRLPTEAEWEYAARARGGAHAATDPGPRAGEQRTPVQHQPGDGGPVQHVRANVWHGDWPVQRDPIKGFNSTTPVGSFKANALGLHDMIGNVWEWTADWYAADYYGRSPKENPQGPENGEYRVARGGSWFCSPAYCSAYNTHYRGASSPDQGFTNVGFRCAKDWPEQ